MPKLRIAIPIYPGVDLIDATVTFDALSRIPLFRPDLDFAVDLVAKTLAPLATGQRGLLLTPTKTFAGCADGIEVLLVPGAQDTSGATDDPEFMDFVRTHAARADYVTSVCTGAIVLAKAGLLDGYRATTHWLAIDSLKNVSEKILVVNGWPRWVHDRNRMTGGGISSSLDATIYLISLLTDEQTAKCVQLLLQYHPRPPFDSGDPGVADTATFLRVAYGA